MAADARKKSAPDLGRIESLPQLTSLWGCIGTGFPQVVTHMHTHTHTHTHIHTHTQIAITDSPFISAY